MHEWGMVQKRCPARARRANAPPEGAEKEQWSVTIDWMPLPWTILALSPEVLLQSTCVPFLGGVLHYHMYIC